jgi:hypothetical protein
VASAAAVMLRYQTALALGRMSPSLFQLAAQAESSSAAAMLWMPLFSSAALEARRAGWAVQ